MIRVSLPRQLCDLAKVDREVTIQLEGPASISRVLDILESRFPALRGTIRDQVTLQRRPFIRFFTLGEDISQRPPTDPLPEQVVSGEEPIRVIGAMAGG